MDELSLSMGFVVSPVTNILGSIRPDLLTMSITESTLPLSSILSLRGESVGLAGFTGSVGVPLASDGLNSLFLGEVLAAS